MVIRWDWYNKLKGEYPCPLWTYLVEVFVVRWILEKDPKLVFLVKPFMIGYIIENKYFDWIILSGRREKILGATERVCQLVQRSCWTLSTSLLTNQQFINCAFLENTSPSTYPVPCLALRLPCTRVAGHSSVLSLRVSLKTSRRVENDWSSNNGVDWMWF